MCWIATIVKYKYGKKRHYNNKIERVYTKQNHQK